MLELWQTEWCPASQRVRARLTELGVDYVVRQVPVDRERRVELHARTGGSSIPALVTPEGEIVTSEGAIRSYLDTHLAEPPDVEAHRLTAAAARRRYLEEECGCSQPASH